MLLDLCISQEMCFHPPSHAHVRVASQAPSWAPPHHLTAETRSTPTNDVKAIRTPCSGPYTACTTCSQITHPIPLPHRPPRHRRRPSSHPCRPKYHTPPQHVHTIHTNPLYHTSTPTIPRTGHPVDTMLSGHTP